MASLDEFLRQKLQKRMEENSFRSLIQAPAAIDFTSNDYLGLARSAELFNLIQDKLKSEDIKKNGATGSRLLSGNSSYYEEVETKLSAIFKSEAALIFNSGYSANLAILSSLPQKGDTIIYDELVHACIKDGARLSTANRFSFKHNSLDDLEQKIKRSTGKIFIAVESVYSMDGDECPLQELVLLSEKYDFTLILDEAHTTGVRGEKGSGLATSLGLQNRIPIRIYTFGKAMGLHGACVAGSSTLIQYIINFARPFIYTTALPPHALAAIDGAFDFLSKNIHLQEVLRRKIDLFCREAIHSGSGIKSTSAIQAIIIKGNEHVRKAARQLQQKGFDVRPIVSPTVQPGSERLRICLHTYNTDDEVKKLTDSINRLQNRKPYLPE